MILILPELFPIYPQVEIYKSECDQNWLLEVVDEDGTSTVWNDLFKSDQAAMDEVLNTIEEEGLSAFRDSANIVPFPQKWANF